VWLDGGLNIGAFSVYAAELCERVVAIEPSEGNVSVAERNLEVNGITNVTVLTAALVGDDRSEVLLYLNTGKGKTLHTTVRRKTRPAVRVPAVNINDAISDYGITKLKLDVEGEEVGIIQGLTDDSLDQIDEIIMEWHPYLGGLNRSQQVYDECILKLRRRLPKFDGKELLSKVCHVVHLSLPVDNLE
jgi:FkbM family methyltransferase